MKPLFMVALVACAFLIGCIDDSEGYHTAPPALNQSNIRYVKDSRTGLCFAAYNSATDEGYVVTSLSNVPCESVGSLLGADPNQAGAR
jgi:hypothetical protein